MADLRQPHPEALLMLHMDIPGSIQLSSEAVNSLLYRQAALGPTVPYKWSFIDKPKDGEIYLIYHRGGPLADGLMYLEQEHRFLMPKQPQTQAPDIECFEARQGFIPTQDGQAFRIRRRFHFARPPGNPHLFLVHYTRAQTPVHVAAHLHQQIRSYPLPNLPPINIFVVGPRAGEMVNDEEARHIIATVQARAPDAFYSHQRGPPPSHPTSTGYGGVGQDISTQTAYLRELERKKRMMAAAARRDEEDSPDEDAAVSVRTLALSRYRRNHELMEEVFQRAAFGTKKPDTNTETLQPLTLEDINARLASTLADVADLESKAAERQRLRDEKEQATEAMVS